jgi:cell division transport system permease protein
MNMRVRMLAPTSGLMPPDSASGATLHTIVAVMSFLACLTLGAVLTLSRMASEWTEGLSGSVTVQLLPSPQIGGDDQLSDALRITRAWPGIFAARPLSRDEAMGLLEPWLGDGNVLADLPVPQLVEVTLVPGKQIDLAGLGKALKEQVPGATLDDHQRWNRELASFAASSEAVGWAVLLLITLATLAIIIFATQAGLQAHREIVEVVHMIGARDVFIASEFQRHFMWLGLRGGLIGLALAIATLLLSSMMWDSRDAPVGAQYLPQLVSAPWHYVWLLLVPLITGAIALASARMTVLRVLGRMP